MGKILNVNKQNKFNTNLTVSHPFLIQVYNLEFIHLNL